MVEANAQYVLGAGGDAPYREGPPPPGWSANRAMIVRCNRAGFLTIGGQEGGKYRGRPHDGTPFVDVEQRSTLVGFMPAPLAEAVYRELVGNERLLMLKAQPPVHPVHAAAITVSLIDGEPSGYLMASHTGPLVAALPHMAGLADLQDELELASVAFVDLRWHADARTLIRAVDAALQQCLTTQ